MGVALRQAEAGTGIRPGGSRLTAVTQPQDLGLRVEAAADDQIGPTGFQGFDGAADRSRLVLTIAIHHQHQIAGGIQQSLFDRAGQTGATNPADQAQPRLVVGELTHQLSGSIGGIVIDDQNFQVPLLTEGKQLGQERLDIAPFVVRGQNNRDPQAHGILKTKPAGNPAGA